MWELSGYVRNLIECNRFFEDDYRLEGVTETQDGVSLVISQPYVQGHSPTEEEIAEWFTLQGCARRGSYRWEYPNGSIVGDTHTGNLLKLAEGHLMPIDVHVFLRNT